MLKKVMVDIIEWVFVIETVAMIIVMIDVFKILNRSCEDGYQYKNNKY